MSTKQKSFVDTFVDASNPTYSGDATTTTTKQQK